MKPKLPLLVETLHWSFPVLETLQCLLEPLQLSLWRLRRHPLWVLRPGLPGLLQCLPQLLSQSLLLFLDPSSPQWVVLLSMALVLLPTLSPGLAASPTSPGPRLRTPTLSVSTPG